MRKDIKTYWTLFISTFYISAFTFGGGFIIVPLLKKKFCDELNWIEEDKILDLIAIAQSSPGAIAVNASIIIGYKIAGILGAVITAFATVLPPFIILSIVSLFYTAFKENVVVSSLLKGMQAGIAAVITDVVINMGSGIVKSKEIISITLMCAAFVATFFFNVNILILIFTGGFIGAICAIIKKKTDDKEISK